MWSENAAATRYASPQLAQAPNVVARRRRPLSLGGPKRARWRVLEGWVEARWRLGGRPWLGWRALGGTRWAEHYGGIMSDGCERSRSLVSPAQATRRRPAGGCARGVDALRGARRGDGRVFVWWGGLCVYTCLFGRGLRRRTSVPILVSNFQLV